MAKEKEIRTMKKTLLAAFFLAVLSALAAPAQNRGPLPPPGLKKYYVIFVIRHGAPPRTGTPADRQLLARHLAYVGHLLEQRKYLVAGPFTDSGKIAGMAIAAAPSLAAARALAMNDPEIKTGRYKVEVHPALFPPFAGAATPH
jgi:uncharacterized protein YciI